MKLSKHAIMKKVKTTLEAVFWVLIFLSILIPNSTSFWNPHL